MYNKFYLLSMYNKFYLLSRYYAVERENERL